MKLECLMPSKSFDLKVWGLQCMTFHWRNIKEQITVCWKVTETLSELFSSCCSLEVFLFNHWLSMCCVDCEGFAFNQNFHMGPICFFPHFVCHTYLLTHFRVLIFFFYKPWKSFELKFFLLLTIKSMIPPIQFTFQCRDILKMIFFF